MFDYRKAVYLFVFWKARGYTFKRDGVYKDGGYEFSVSDAVKRYEARRKV